MNCKQNDLAMIKAGPSAGLIVACIAPYTGGWTGGFVGPGWFLDRPILKKSGAIQPTIADKYLRPIRPGAGEDETLQWKAVPSPLVAAPKKQGEAA